MKRVIAWIGMISVVAAMVGCSGCQDDNSAEPVDRERTPAQLQIISGLWNDTLSFVADSSGHTDGCVLVKNARGFNLPGVPVRLFLSRPLGRLEWLDEQLQDSSNWYGQVLFRLIVDDTGEVFIIASAGTLLDSQRIVLMYRLPPPDYKFFITVTPDTIWTDDQYRDSVLVSIRSVPPFPNEIFLQIRGNGGRFRPGVLEFHDGFASIWWWPWEFGLRCFYVFSDSACVMVIPLPQ
jgi:hypothetical protein